MSALLVEGMVKRFRAGWLRHSPGSAVDQVDLEVRRGEVLGLVGESGSGKTTLARASMGLVPFEAGRVHLLEQDLHSMSPAALRSFRRRVQLLFQNPDAHLNPGLRVGAILTESARLHQPDRDAREVVDGVLERIGLASRRAAFPFQLSGGEKRRVGIARVLIADPELVIADELTAGLDAALKAEILDLLLSRRDATRAYLLISHDLAMVAYACDRMAVMLAGRVIERFPTPRLTARHHPYTAALLAAAGLISAEGGTGGPAVGRGQPGCPYVGACPREQSACRHIRPMPVEVAPDHFIACHAVGDTP